MPDDLKVNVHFSAVDVADAEDQWARVELFRLQHGVLPRTPCDGKLDECEGLKKLADIIEHGETSQFPPRFSVAAVLRYAARRINELKQLNRHEQER